MITPWEVEGVVDYKRLMREFGIKPFSEIFRYNSKSSPPYA